MVLEKSRDKRNVQRNTIMCLGRDRLALARIDQSGEAFFMGPLCEMGELLIKVRYNILYRQRKVRGRGLFRVRG